MKTEHFITKKKNTSEVLFFVSSHSSSFLYNIILHIYNSMTLWANEKEQT